MISPLVALRRKRNSPALSVYSSNFGHFAAAKSSTVWSSSAAMGAFLRTLSMPFLQEAAVVQTSAVAMT